MKRLLLLFLALAALVILPFALWGEAFATAMSPERLAAAFGETRRWAWLAGLALLLADLVLPVPGTAVMSALGLVYGWLAGGCLAALGSGGSGVLAYALCRLLGRRAAIWLAGEKGLAEGERIFRGDLGGWVVALSRWMPLLPEVVASLAGLSRMPLRRFFPALAAGSVPMGFAYAWIGHRGEAHPALALLLSAVLPPLIWAAIWPWLKRRKSRDPLTRRT